MFLARTFRTILGPAIVNDCRFTQTAGTRRMEHPKLRTPDWWLKKDRNKNLDNLTPENQKFLEKRVQADFGPRVMHKGFETYESQSLLKVPTIEPKEFRRNTVRVGTIGRKIGHYPLFLKDGTRINTTVLQIVDNHVVKRIAAGEYNPTQVSKDNFAFRKRISKKACLLVGSEAVDPNNLTAQYIGLFKGSGVLPTKYLCRFVVSKESELPPGTPLNVSHYRVGDFVDVRGKTINRGFQGVMKRWGFKGQPATHGQTKTHRRPGSLSSGLRNGIWKGKKMPGHMGYKWRTLRGLKIWRINTKTNTMWVSGHSIAGPINHHVYIYDTILPLRKPKEPLPVPTFLGDESELPEDIYDESVHPYGDPTIYYEPEK